MKKRIIIGCPDKDNREVLKMIFKFSGWDVITCQSLRQVVNMAAQAKPDVVLVEPWEDGSLVTCRQFMNPLLFYSPVVVFYTHKSMVHELQLLKEFGADACLDAAVETTPGLPDRIGNIPARDKTPWA